MSVNKLQELAAIELGWSGPEPRVAFVDLPHQRLVLCGDTIIVTVALAAFNLPAEPIVAVARLPETVVSVSQGIDFNLEPASAGVEIKLVSGPPGLTLDGSRLKWQTKLSDCGIYPVKLEYRHGELTGNDKFRIEVRTDFVRLPFDIRRFSVSADGHYAVAWGPDSFTTERRDLLALIDLSSRAIVAQCRLDTGVQDAEVGSSGVYAYTPKSLLRLSLTDLSKLAEKDMGAKSEDAIYLVADRFAFSPASGQILDVPSLRELGPGRAPCWQHAGRLHSGWLWDGVVWDDSLEKARWLLTLPGSPATKPYNSTSIPTTPCG